MTAGLTGAATSALPALLLLADGRFPAGGHAHSGGLEAAVAREGVHDVTDLVLFLRGRLGTVGLVAATFAAAACRAAQGGDGGICRSLEVLDGELDARTASPTLRITSRRLGRQLVRAGRTIWPHPTLDDLAASSGRGPHQPVALGVVAAVAGLRPGDAALAAAHEAVTGPAMAAVRLLGLDPFSVHAALARLGPQVQDVATDGARSADSDPADYPSRTGPLLDVFAEHHATWEVRLFAS